MVPHKWTLVPKQDPGIPTAWAASSDSRSYRCSACGAGPIRIDGMESKAGITRRAKAMGIPSDCNEAEVKKILDR